MNALPIAQPVRMPLRSMINAGTNYIEALRCT